VKQEEVQVSKEGKNIAHKRVLFDRVSVNGRKKKNGQNQGKRIRS
jgi:hypothetical protein